MWWSFCQSSTNYDARELAFAEGPTGFCLLQVPNKIFWWRGESLDRVSAALILALARGETLRHLFRI